MTTTSDDFVVVARTATPTQAHLLRGVLESAGLHAIAADTHLAQGNPLYAQAIGGVRVLVKASDAEAARQALADYDAGDLALPEEPGAPRPQPLQTLGTPIYSPDLAALLSFFLVSPAFGAGIHLLNARHLPPQGSPAVAWLWLLVLAGANLATMALLAMGAAAPLSPALAALGTSLLTAAWYLGTAQPHNRVLVETYGTGYPRRSLVPLALGVFGLQGLLMWVFSETLS